MYKIFIIDDEPMIVKGLKELVPWEDINCYISGSAKNGEEGFEAITKDIPDIVISDIHMPKLSGLQMIDKLRTLGQDMKFIILTGHRDFDYARKAIELGVVKYLLKPTNIEDIKAAVLDAMMLLDDERSKEEDIKLLREQLEKSTSELAENEIMEESSAISEEEGEHKIKYLAVQGVKFMQEHYSEKIDLQAVADHLYISTWYLCKVFKNELNNSFVQLLNEIRIQEAKKLLTETNQKVYEICEQVGYTDNPYFTKTFKKYTGLTPNQYRNSQYEA